WKMKNSALLLLALACAQPATPPPPPHPPPPPPPRAIFPHAPPATADPPAPTPPPDKGRRFPHPPPHVRGILFFFPQAGEYPFWMKNTLIPLDMIWIDEGKRIAHIAHDVPPCKADPCPNYPPNAHAKYVLELAAGVAAKHHLKDGDILRFERMEQVVVR